MFSHTNLNEINSAHFFPLFRRCLEKSRLVKLIRTQLVPFEIETNLYFISWHCRRRCRCSCCCNIMPIACCFSPKHELSDRFLFVFFNHFKMWFIIRENWTVTTESSSASTFFSPSLSMIIISCCFVSFTIFLATTMIAATATTAAIKKKPKDKELRWIN